MSTIKILRIDVFHALAGLNPQKAYGPDGVPPIVLKNCDSWTILECCLHGPFCSASLIATSFTSLQGHFTFTRGDSPVSLLKEKFYAEGCKIYGPSGDESKSDFTIPALTEYVGDLERDQLLCPVYFGGYFLRNHPVSMHTISFAINYWSRGAVQALFLRHEGYLGAIGAFLLGAEECGMKQHFIMFTSYSLSPLQHLE
ncbi:Pantothenate kinase 4 [Portunus trituberculatus]|uniref:Pantothenate kinase 4 n=1 Tax=Portunus trituberculatus TaxID=210409 RepID=A0A5B7FIG6_PORTR|nr:Pantothenate kinase 4 [Portunus trituberculatus]